MDTFEDSYGCIYLKKGTSIETESRFVVARGGRREVAGRLRAQGFVSGDENVRNRIAVMVATP